MRRNQPDAAIIWGGPDDLAGWLVPLADLERFPGNPRRGQVDEIAESLRRFGQVRPILTDGRRIVAGNHTYLAAERIGWTHISAVDEQFQSEGEARAYLLADNRLPELGNYERSQLAALLGELEEGGHWEGTGYNIDDLEDLRAELDAIERTEAAPFAGGFAADPDELAARAQRLAAGNAFNEVVLTVTSAQHGDFDAHMKILRKEYGLTGISEIVLRAIHNQATA
jgi:hypothetical protein